MSTSNKSNRLWVVINYLTVLYFGFAIVSDCGSFGGIGTGHAELPHSDIPGFAMQQAKYGRVEAFKELKMHSKMAAVTSYTEVHADAYKIVSALLDEDKSTLLEMTKKYEKATPFAPAHFLGKASSVVLRYRDQKGVEATIEKLLGEDKGDWKYLPSIKQRIKNNVQDRIKKSSKLLASCNVSKNPGHFHDAPGTGLISKNTYRGLESEETAGPLTQVKGINGEKLLDTWGQPCLARKAYAREMEEVNECFYKETKRQLRFRYCYRSKEMQAVVKNTIQNTTKCIEGASGASRIARYAQSAGSGPASTPATSRHCYGVALDIDTPVGKGALDRCMPKHWSELEGDPGHWEVKSEKISKLKPGECITVTTAGGRTRKFCKSEVPASAGVCEHRKRMTDPEVAKSPHGKEIVRKSNEVIKAGVSMSDIGNKEVPFEVDGAGYVIVIEKHYHDPIRCRLYNQACGDHAGATTFKCTD